MPSVPRTCPDCKIEEVPPRCRRCSTCARIAELENNKRFKRKMLAQGRCVQCIKPNDRVPLTLCSKCQEWKSGWGRDRLRLLKEEVFDVYGRICACCKESELFFLGLDHIANNGNTDPDSGHQLYARLKREGFPAGFRVLCHNCNLGRHLNGGTCPHGNGI